MFITYIARFNMLIWILNSSWKFVETIDKLTSESFYSCKQNFDLKIIRFLQAKEEFYSNTLIN